MRCALFRSIVTAGLVLFWATALPMFAAPSGEGWSQLETENFILISQVDEGSTRTIGADLERLRFALEQIFDQAAFGSPLSTFLYVFRDQGSFAPYSLGGGEPGYFVPHIHANFAVVVGGAGEGALPVVYRQYIHELVSDNVPALQGWFRHGLAEVFSTFQTTSEEAVVGLRGDTDELGLDAGNLMPLTELLALYDAPTSAPDPQAMQTSWALVHYLFWGDPERFEATRQWVRRSAAEPNYRATLVEALGTDVASLEADLAAYLAQPEVPSHRIPVAGATTEGELAPLAESEALFRLGDLLIHTGDDPARRASASQHFDRVIELAPESAMALGGAGLVRQSAGDLEGAEKFYLEALEKLEDSFRLNFILGDVELELLGKRRPTTPAEEERLATAVAAFERTTILNPDFGEGWARLGYSYNLQTKPNAAAVPALEKGYEMLPDRSDVAYNLLLGYARAGEREEAWSLIATLEARGGDDRTVAQAREVAYQLDFQAAGALAREKRYDDSVGLFSRVAAESSNAEMQQRAASAISGIAVAATANDFPGRYSQAVETMATGDKATAAERATALAADAAPGMQAEIVNELLRRIEDSP